MRMLYRNIQNFSRGKTYVFIEVVQGMCDKLSSGFKRVLLFQAHKKCELKSYTCLLFFTFGLHTSWSNTFCFQFCLGTHMEGQDKLECKGSIEKLLKNCNRFYPENCLFLTKSLFFFFVHFTDLVSYSKCVWRLFGDTFFLLPYFMWNLHGIPWHPKIRTFITLHKEMYLNFMFLHYNTILFLRAHSLNLS